jgi:hypothetical protein
LHRYSCLTWGYNNNKYNVYRIKSTDEWFYRYKKTERHPFSWRDECIFTAKYIRECTSEPISILVSGGVDSLSCCESFRHAGIPFTAYTFDFGHNEHDIKYAIDYCNSYGIKHIIHKISIEQFFDKDLERYSDYVQCRNPQTVFQSWMIDQIDGFPILGLGELYICVGNTDEKGFYGQPQAPVNGGKVLMFEGEQYQANERMLRLRNREGAPKFFVFTPELKLSNMIAPETIAWIKEAKTCNYIDTDEYIQSNNSNFRNLFYLSYFPAVGLRPPIQYERFKGSPKTLTRNDYTGFEYISSLHRKYQEKLYEMYQDEYNQFSWVPYMDKVRSLTDDEELISNIETQVKGY